MCVNAIYNVCAQSRNYYTLCEKNKTKKKQIEFWLHGGITASAGKAKAVHALIKGGATITIQDGEGKTALDLAHQFKKTNAAKLLESSLLKMQQGGNKKHHTKKK